GLQSTQQPSTTSTNQYHPNFSFDVSQLWGQVKVDGGAAGQKMDVFTMNYPAPLGSQFSVVFSFINTSQGIPTSFFGEQLNFLNGSPQAQFQSGRGEPTGYTVIGAPNVTYSLGIGTDVYSLSVRFWLNTQNNILGGNYYPNGTPVSPAATNPVTAPPPATAVPVNPSTGQVYTSSINPAKQLNLNVYNAAPLIDHIANNQLTSNQDFNNVLSIVALLPTAAQTESSFHQVIAEPYASVLSVTLEALNTFRQACFRAAGAGRSIKLPEDERWSVFTDVGNTQANMSDPNNGLSSFNYNIFQSILGVEYAVTKDFSTGLVMGYGFDQVGSFEYNSANLYANNVSVALMEKYNPGKFRFTGLMGYSNFQYTSTRQINFGSPSAGYVNRQAQGRWQSDGLVAAVGAGYEQKLGPVIFTPGLLLSYAYQLQQGIKETGANSLDLQVNAAQASSMILAPGFQLQAPITLKKGLILTPKAFASWEHDFLADYNQNHQVTASFANVPEPGSLTILGQNRGTDAVNVEAGIELTVNQRWAIYAGAQYQYWGTVQELGYNTGLKYSF
ncbi:MAG: autotransporter outer membrane beta-barrel domain-containing protein, partial [Chthoniobacterales bacterium]|nr:autotransporter outer membrane beta-barrel domain-containing protein [Chthoniobacterales bacterium]